MISVYELRLQDESLFFSRSEKHFVGQFLNRYNEVKKLIGEKEAEVYLLTKEGIYYQTSEMLGGIRV